MRTSTNFVPSSVAVKAVTVPMALNPAGGLPLEVSEFFFETEKQRDLFMQQHLPVTVGINPAASSGNTAQAGGPLVGHSQKVVGLSNLDLTGYRRVKRGCIVSWHGLRFTVSKVNRGYCYPVQPSAAGHFVLCRSVQVVG
jgi:hypothetical protein